MNNKYKYNHEFFDKIDTSEKAQILGLFYADGCNFMKKNQIQLTLKMEDENYLELIRKKIECEKPLQTLKYKNLTNDNNSFYKKIDIYSKHMCQTLNNLGCIPRKSLILKFPTEQQVPLNFIRDFIRGYFEGDGSIIKYKTKNIYSISFCGTLEFCKSLEDIFFSKLKIKCTWHKRHKNKSNNYSISFGGNLQVIKFLIWLYKDAPFYMKRKYDRYLFLLKSYDNCSNYMKILFNRRVRVFLKEIEINI